MADANVRASDPRNNQMVGKVSLWFKKKGDQSFLDLGNIINPEIAPTLTRLDHFSFRRGVRAKDKSVITERSANLNFTIDEINLPNLQLAFLSKAATEATETVIHDDTIRENKGGGVAIPIGVPDIVSGSLVVRNINHEDEQTFVEGVDYTIDYAGVSITPIPSSALDNLDPDSGFPEIHIQYDRDVEGQSFEMFPGTDVNGEAQFQILTDEGVKLVANFKNVNLRNNGSIKFGDGSKYEEIGLQMEILEDKDGQLGTVVILNAGELPTV